MFALGVTFQIASSFLLASSGRALRSRFFYQFLVQKREFHKKELHCNPSRTLIQIEIYTFVRQQACARDANENPFLRNKKDCSVSPVRLPPNAPILKKIIFLYYRNEHPTAQMGHLMSIVWALLHQQIFKNQLNFKIL